MKLGALLLAVACAGCGTTPNPASCVDNHCSDPARPFCDKDGSIGGEPNTCIAVACTPGEFERCDGDNAMHCNALGTSYEELQCEEGCSDSKGCNECEDVGSCAPPTHIVPRFLPAECDDLGGESNDLIVTQSRTIDTSVDATCNGGVVTQANGALLCVLRYRSVLVASGQTLKVIGARGIAFVTDDALSIEGVLDVSADLHINGPGGGIRTSGPAISGLGGDGGAGFKTAGGRGGDGASSAGPAIADPVFDASLPGGFRAQGLNALGAAGGGGGGAATLISCRGTVTVSGIIDAGGGGGFGGTQFIGGLELTASGGGSGGYVALQGRQVTLTGSMFANGGGGGAGRNTSDAQNGGAIGADATRDFIISAPGGIGVNGGGSGGNGAVAFLQTDAPGNDGGLATGSNGAGGGGGGLGFLQIHTPFGVEPIVMGGTSPVLQPHRKLDLK